MAGKMDAKEKNFGRVSGRKEGTSFANEKSKKKGRGLPTGESGVRKAPPKESYSPGEVKAAA